MINRIAEGYDMHCHLLWGVDDGSRSAEMSMELLEMEYDQGVRHICVTPHFIPGSDMVTREQLIPVYEQLRQMAADRWQDMNLYLGQELAWDTSLPAALEQGLAGTLADTAYVLVEFHPGAGMREIQKAVNRLLSDGYRPVIAHMERVPEVAAKRNLVRELKNMGAFIQVNLEDLLGNIWNKETRITRNLIKERLVDVTGTDAHRSDWRPVIYEEPVRWLQTHCPEDYRNEILYENPAAILGSEKMLERL